MTEGAIERIDDHTVRFHLNRPDLGVPEVFGDYPALLVHRRFSDDGGDLRANPVGTGPYRLAEHSVGQRMTLERRAPGEYWGDGFPLEKLVYVDLGDSNTAALTAMSHSDPDLMDGDTAYKAWKLVEGGTDGANIGDDYWFRVDVVGSTAVPALPLVGQLLLALFLMAGGARLYRRRQG